MSLRRRRGGRGLDVWPGYVDVLSALLILVIFVLMLFTFAQFLMSELLSSQKAELFDLQDRIAELSQQLGLERERGEALGQEVEQLAERVTLFTRENYELSGQVEALERRAAVDAATIETQLRSLASLNEDIDALRKVRAELEARVGELAAGLEAGERALGAERDRSRGLEAQLADQRERTLLAQRELEQREIRIQALAALVGEQETALAEQRALSADARAQLAAMRSQLEGLQAQLAEVGRALAVAEREKGAQRAEIEDLGRRLNIALARKVNRLERYRSEFFGRLREALGDNPSVRVVGDRFLFQAELLFASGEAELGPAGRHELDKLVATLQELERRIPAELEWILRVDGHTDRVPIASGRFRSNWELSTARAVSVVRYLIERGVPPERLAAAGFGEYHPLDPGEGPEAYRRNRRIEIKLTSR